MKFTKRKGRNVQVSYDDGKTWKTTKYKTITEAKIALMNTSGEVTLGDYCQKLYFNDSIGSLKWKDKARGKALVPSVYKAREGIVQNYILPDFKNELISRITARQVENWILELKSYKYHTKLANTYKKRILAEFNVIMREAIVDGFITTNTLNSIVLYNDSEYRKEILTKNELQTIFPNDKDKLIEIWETYENAVYFALMNETGFRPCEIAGLKKEDFNFKNKTLLTKREYIDFEMRIVDRIKTSRKGQDYKIGVLSTFLNELVQDYFTTLDRDYLFYDGVPKKLCYIKNKVFHKVTSKYLGKAYTQYNLRHTFMTNLIGKYPKEVIMELMGHTTWEDCYDNRDSETITNQLLEKLM